MWIDTSRESPDDICEWRAAPLHPGLTYDIGPRSLVVLNATVQPAATEATGAAAR